MHASNRTCLALALTALALVPAAQAQIPGMPLFSNPRYGTGLRVHADWGQPVNADNSARVIEGGVSLALGPIGLSATVGTLKQDLKNTQTCINAPTADCSSQHISASALAQLRIMGGGARSNMSLSLFGGGATDLTAADFIDCTQFTGIALTTCQSEKAKNQVKALTIPVGAAIGYRIPLGMASLNLWGAPRYSLIKYTNCAAGDTRCDASMTGKFRWAVGADFPILRILSIRAAYDSGKQDVNGVNTTVSYWGLGASIGFGGVR